MGWGRNNFTVAFSVKFQILLVVHKMLRLKTDMRLDTFQKNVSRQTLHPVICHLNNNVITIVVVVVVTTNYVFHYDNANSMQPSCSLEYVEITSNIA